MVECLVSVRYLLFFSKLGRGAICFAEACRHAWWTDLSSDPFFCKGCVLIVLALKEMHLSSFFLPIVWRRQIKEFLFSQNSAFTLHSLTFNTLNSSLPCAWHSWVSPGCGVWQAYWQLPGASGAATFCARLDQDQIWCILYLVAEKQL